MCPDERIPKTAHGRFFYAPSESPGRSQHLGAFFKLGRLAARFGATRAGIYKYLILFVYGNSGFSDKADNEIY
jgi:hypothetical protein